MQTTRTRAEPDAGRVLSNPSLPNSVAGHHHQTQGVGRETGESNWLVWMQAASGLTHVVGEAW
jgi:hypothetical protein